jgi:hypothetical protein
VTSDNVIWQDVLCVASNICNSQTRERFDSYHTHYGQKTCPKHVDFYSTNKFEKLVHLVGFIIRILHKTVFVQPSLVFASKPLHLVGVLNHLPYTILITKHSAARYCCLAMSIRKHIHCSPLSTDAPNSCLRTVTIPDAVTIQFDLLKMSMVLLETCRGL